jgi:triosephosphate isomerase
MLDDPSRVVIAYEPVWAIGTGASATPLVAQGMHTFIRSALEAAYGSTTGRGIRLLYGGSMKPGNALALLEQPDIDGGLVGGASLDAESFAALADAAAEALAMKV